MKRAPALRPDEVRCAECKRPMLKAAAVILNGETLNPIGCFEPALKRYMSAVNRRIRAHAGAIDLSVSMESASPEVAMQLGKLTGDLLRARRASR